MKRSDILVEVRDRTLARKGTITSKFLRLKSTIRWSNVGDWTVTLPGNHPMVPVLSTEGSGIVVSIRGVEKFSGPTSAPSRKRDRVNPDGTYTFSGVTDEIVLADALAFPQPSNATASTQNVTNDTRTGTVEHLMYEYVSRNIGPLAPAGRKAGLRSLLTMGTDLGRGVVATKAPRFQNLLELLQELAVLDTGMGFRVVQVGAALVFEVVPTVDRTDLVRLDIGNGTLTSEEVRVTGPAITRAIVAGQGEGTDREIVVRTMAAPTAAEATWGRVIERFIDQRQAGATVELQQAGDEALYADGFTATSVKVIPSDDQTMLYGEDWNEGDLVTIVVNGQETATSVTAAALVVDQTACAVGAAIGDVTGFDRSAALTQRVEDIDRRVGNLERSEASQDFVPDLGDPNADRILFWDDSAGTYTWLSVSAPLAITGTALAAAAATTAAAGIVELATPAEDVTGTDASRASTPAGVAAAIAAQYTALNLADLAALPSAAGIAEGRRFHIDALNVDFEQVDGVWVQQGRATVASTASRDTEYAKASSAYLIAGVEVLVTADSTTYRRVGSNWVRWRLALTSWTPTITGYTLGNGTIAGWYGIEGGRVQGEVKIVHGSTSSIGTNPRVTFPETPHSTFLAASMPLGVVTFRDVSAADQWASHLLVFPTDLLSMWINRVSQPGTYAAASAGQVVAWSAGNPIAAATGDIFGQQFSYPIANAF